MDEPLSNLDAKLRVQMRTEIAKLHNRIGTTTIYVTHDQTEAMTMADRIVVLKDGVVQQIASPQQMYDHPDNVFVAGFLGSPAMNFIRARLERDKGGYAATFGRTRVPIDREIVGEKGHELGAYEGKEVVLGIRPEHIEDASVVEANKLGGTNAPNTIEAEPQVIESMGSGKDVYFSIPKEQTIGPDTMEDMTAGSGAEGSVDSSRDLMVARVSTESQARMGHEIRLLVDASKVRLFNPETEKAIT
jgi:multiple sugar transport system ATP-binding protein